MIAGIDEDRGQICGACLLQNAGVRDIGNYDSDFRVERTVVDRAEDGFKIAPDAAAEHAEAKRSVGAAGIAGLQLV